MKQTKSYDYDELERFRDWAEAEYCPICAGAGEIRRTQAINGPEGVVYDIPAWVECHACHGTGRA